MTGPRSKAITRSVNRLCAELREDAATLVDAFAIPDGVLAAPIGLRDPS
jgi:acyl-CoA oxidase